MKKTVLFLFLICFSAALLQAEIRAFWAPPWDINSREKIDRLVVDAACNNFNTIVAEIRYRGDALYVPNKNIRTYINPENISSILEEDFDPLQYLIDKSGRYNIQVYAWVTTFVATTRREDTISKNNVYNKNPEWVTCDNAGRRMDYDSYEGAYLDPGVPEVHDYLLNIIKDIVVNYDIDGLQFDYIRYPAKKFGYNPISIENYNRYCSSTDNSITFDGWKQKQISDFVKRAYLELKHIDPNLVISAAVIPNAEEANRNVAQDWITWLEDDYLDQVFLMAYTKSTTRLKRDIASLEKKDILDRCVIGLRAWSEKGYYPYRQLSGKISELRFFDKAGLCFFYYNGLKKNNFLAKLKRDYFKHSVPVYKRMNSDVGIYGFVKDDAGRPVSMQRVVLNELESTYTDENGFYSFNNIKTLKNVVTTKNKDMYEYSGFIDFNLPEIANIEQFDFILKDQRLSLLNYEIPSSTYVFQYGESIDPFIPSANQFTYTTAGKSNIPDLFLPSTILNNRLNKKKEIENFYKIDL